jgi:DNA polymerase I
MSGLLLIDGHAILHRAYHALPKLNTFGLGPTNAIYGFSTMLLKSIRELKPDYLAVCMDPPGPNFRNDLYIAYRTNRKPTDLDLISQFPLAHDLLKDLKIATFMKPGYEADDLLATLAKRFIKLKPSSKVIIITGDKDLMQLVTKKVNLFMPIRGLSATQLFGPRQVKEKLGVKPSQVVDLKALMGDPSDNYPGIIGVGPKTATTLLSEFKTLDNIYKNLNKIKSPLREKIKKAKQDAYLSQSLAKIIDDVPAKLSLKKIRWTREKMDNFKPAFQKFNFHSLVFRLEGKKNTSPQKTKPPSSQTPLF